MKQYEMNEIKTLFEDKDFSDKIAMCNSPAEMAAVFTEAGVEVDPITFEEALAAAVVNEKNGELSEDDLDSISGGCPFLVGAALYSIGCLAWACYSARSRRKRK